MLETQPWNKAASGASRKVAMARKAENSCNCQEMIKHQHQDASQHKSQLLNNFFGICSEWLNSWRGATPAPSLEVAVSSSVSINLLSEFLGTLGGTAAVAAPGCCAFGVGARLCGRLGHPGAQGPWIGDWGQGTGAGASPVMLPGSTRCLSPFGFCTFIWVFSCTEAGGSVSERGDISHWL